MKEIITKIHEGRWQDTLDYLTQVDSVITDAPYSAKTHDGSIKRSTGEVGGHLTYDHVTPEICDEFVRSWAPRVNNWMVIFGDHISSKWWEDSLKSAGLYVFAPVYYIKRNPMPRMQGDGPTSSGEVMTRAATEKQVLEMAISLLNEKERRLFDFDEEEGVITVARHKVKVKESRSRPGHYMANTQTSNQICAGQKDLETCCKIVEDYSSPGDIVVDPFAGYATISQACRITGRTSFASEARSHIFAQSKLRLKGPVQLRAV